MIGHLLQQNVKISFFLLETSQPEDGDKKVNEHDCSNQSVDQEQRHCQRRLS